MKMMETYCRESQSVTETSCSLRFRLAGGAGPVAAAGV